MNDNAAHAAHAIELLLLDVDGVLTDGRITYMDDGVEIKSFHVRDGAAIKLWQHSGKRVAILSGRTSAAVERRARELGIAYVVQGAGEKWPALQRLLIETGLEAKQVCAIGDDLPDRPLLMGCGLGITVADGDASLQQMAAYVTKLAGGQGAVREAIEWLMRLQGTWDAAIARLHPTA